MGDAAYCTVCTNFISTISHVPGIRVLPLQTLSGVLWTAAASITSGLWRRREGDLLADCVLEVRRTCGDPRGHPTCVQSRETLTFLSAYLHT